MPSPSYKEKHTLPIVPDPEREWALDRPSGEALGVTAKPATLTDDPQVASSPIVVGRGPPVANGFDSSEVPDAGGQPVTRYSTVQFITVFYALTLSTFLFAVSSPSYSFSVLDGPREMHWRWTVFFLALA